MATQHDGDIDTIYDRLTELATEIRGLRECGLLPSEQARKAEHLHRQLVDLNRVILRQKVWP